tara:strand:+ start:459 stop:617 length:159 start_codon:yes stop_codon:yes gene_type:complete
MRFNRGGSLEKRPQKDKVMHIYVIKLSHQWVHGVLNHLFSPITVGWDFYNQK